MCSIRDPDLKKNCYIFLVLSFLYYLIISINVNFRIIFLIVNCKMLACMCI